MSQNPSPVSPPPKSVLRLYLQQSTSLADANIGQSSITVYFVYNLHSSSKLPSATAPPWFSPRCPLTLAMSPINPCIISQLRQLVYYHLDNHLLRNALFFAGRLQAYDQRSPDSAYLLALCHYRLGQLKSAYDSSRHWVQRGANSHLGCSYVFAQACLGLGKYIEGTAALDKSKGVWLHKSNWSEFPDPRLTGKALISHINRQTFRQPTTSSARCSSHTLSPRKIMASTSRLYQGNRKLCRSTQAEFIHVGRIHWPLRSRYGRRRWFCARRC